MAKARSLFSCQNCSAQSPRWLGRCPECGEWNSYVEEIQSADVKTQNAKQKISVKPEKLSAIALEKVKRLKTGFAEFDRVLGGGIVPGSVILVAGDPGVGKSTLLLQMVGKIGGMYISGEESVGQIALRAKRLGITHKQLLLLAGTDLESIQAAVAKHEIKAPVIIDSIQTISSDRLTGMAGTVGQIRESAFGLIQVAKRHSIPIFIIGHVTKEGAIAGPKILEHMVDVVCYLEGERHYQGRMVRTFKNRFGPTDEVGIFEMEDEGLVEVSNPSKLFLQNRVTNVPGSCVAVVMEGTRPIMLEIQSLTVQSELPIPRRVVNGVALNRLQMILAVLQKRLGLAIGTSDVFVNVSGGMKVSEPAADLAVAMSIISAFKNKPLASTVCAFGELGLLGEIKQVPAAKRRQQEAERLGYKTVYSGNTHHLLAKLAKTVF